MFGRKKARGSKQAASEGAKRVAKMAEARGQRLAKEASDKIKDRMSPAEKTKAQGNSTIERRKSTPSV
jgi:hypothetical protein